MSLPPSLPSPTVDLENAPPPPPPPPPPASVPFPRPPRTEAPPPPTEARQPQQPSTKALSPRRPRTKALWPPPPPKALSPPPLPTKAQLPLQPPGKTIARFEYAVARVEGMRRAVEEAVAGVEAMSDAERQSFKCLIRRYVMGKEEVIPRCSFRPPRAEAVVSYEKLTLPFDTNNLSSKGTEDVHNLLSKIVVVKLLRVTSLMSTEYLDSVALDKIVHEINSLNEKFGTDIPLILMIPYNNYDQIRNGVQAKYKDFKLHIISICQGKYPYLDLDMSPTATASSAVSGDQFWYDPGDGNTFDALYDSRKLQSLIYKKKEYMFISNLDNSNGTLDINILYHVVARKISFGMEVVQRKHDTIGQLVVSYQGQLQLQDIKCIEELMPQEDFKYYSTNNLWMNLVHLRDIIEEEGLRHDLIPYVHRNDGNEFISFKIAAARCMKLFEKAILISVPDSRVNQNPNATSQIVSNENPRGEIISTTAKDLGTRAERSCAPSRCQDEICSETNTSYPERGSHYLVDSPSPLVNSGTLPITKIDPASTSNPIGAHFPDYILQPPGIPLLYRSGAFNIRGLLRVVALRLIDKFKLKPLGELLLFYIVYHIVLLLFDGVILDHEKNEVRSSWYGSASSLVVAMCMQITLRFRRRRRHTTLRFHLGVSGIEIPQLHEMTVKALRRQDDSDLFHNFVHAIAHFIYMGLEKTIKHGMVINHWKALSIRHSIAAFIEIIGSYIVEIIFKTEVNLG